MKNAGITLAALALLLTLLTGCSAAPSAATTTDGAATTVPGGTTASEPGNAAGYVFEFKGVTIQMHAETLPILEKLGKEKSYFEAESCAFQGIEKTYTYPSFSLCTYELDGADHVASLLFLDDAISTPEGIALNSKLDDVLKTYGDQYTKSLGLYSYESGKMKLTFLIESNLVASIEYVALAE
jgi:hypothetical protein